MTGDAHLGRFVDAEAKWTAETLLARLCKARLRDGMWCGKLATRGFGNPEIATPLCDRHAEGLDTHPLP